ncbi:MAG: hypothetical protein ACYS7Y_04350 [Planctomycetota bacterium]|jgi:hypothetical protein
MKTIGELTVDGVVLRDVEVTDHGDTLQYTVPDIIYAGGATFQQVTIEDGISEPVSKEAFKTAIEQYFREHHNEE